MCGIAGYFGSQEISEERIGRCLRLMHRRGPDAAAWKRFRTPGARNCYFLSTRLAIIDLDPRANQPLEFGAKRLIFNGELYNYRELKAGLASGGRQFRTTSDTEVMLQLLDAEGSAGLDRCEGMWAFAVYNESDGSLLLSRDRFGEKPLYLYRDASGLYFGSEAKCIAALLGRRLEVNTAQLYRYLVNGYKSLYKSRQTFFAGLSELPAGTVLRVTHDGREGVERYWQPAFVPEERMSYDEAVAGARERLITAVRLRLRADVPLAFCMSGGVDSYSLVAIAKRVLGYDVHGFTITNLDPRYDEEALVGHAVRELGIRHTAVPADTSGFLEKLKVLVRQHDAPVYTITYYAHWLLMEAMAKAGYRVAVSGTAADEFFSGYYDHHLLYLAAVRHDPERWASALGAWQEYIKPLARNPFLGDAERFVNDPGFRSHIYLDADTFAAYLNSPWQEPFFEERYTSDLLRNRMLNELLHETIPVILHEDDLNAMYFSIENRSPYLDRTLFEFAFSIPTRHLIRDGFAKAVLRDAVAGIVPDRIRMNRRKVGFNASIHSFLDLADPAVQGELLAESPIYDHVRREKIAALIAKPALSEPESKFLFSFLSAKMFLEAFSA